MDRLADWKGRIAALDAALKPILEEIAEEISSDVNKYGMGSTRTLLISANIKRAEKDAKG